MPNQILANLEAPAHCFIQGASRGIGLGFARRLLDADHVACVYASARDPQRSDALVELERAHPDRLKLVALDVTDESTIAKAAQRVRDEVGELHFLFNVAGILHDASTGLKPEKSLRDLDPANLHQIFGVNAFGPILMAKHFHSLFRHGRRAVWANMSARVGSIGDNYLGGWYGYRASKAALNQFTRTMSIEMGRKAPETVVVALHPGTVDTALSEPFQGNVKPEKLFSVERAVDQLLDVLDGLGPDDTGGFFAWDGQAIEW